MSTPHDELFRFVFRQPAHAASWLQSVVCTQVASALDWSTLAAASEHLTGLRLRAHVADLVFAVHSPVLGDFVMVIVEHKSGPDPEAHEQLLRYVVHVRHLLRRRGVQPAVLPAVFHHGPAPLVRRIADAENPFAAFEPRFEPVVDDLAGCGETDLRRPALTALARLTLLCLRFLPEHDAGQALAAIDRWSDLLRTVADGTPEAMDTIDAIGWYVLDVTDVTEEQLQMAFAKHLNQPEGTRMTTGQRIRIESRNQGRAEGKAEGKAEVLLRLLDRRFGPLPADIASRVQAASLAELDRWTDRILDAPTLAEVFARA